MALYYLLSIDMINKADKLLTKIDNEMNLIENHSYLSILNLYKNSSSLLILKRKY